MFRRAGNITGMGIRYGEDGLEGSRFHDFEWTEDGRTKRAYSCLDYSKFTLFLFGDKPQGRPLPEFWQEVRVPCQSSVPADYWGKAVLVRPDAYIEVFTTLASGGSSNRVISSTLPRWGTPRSDRRTSWKEAPI